MPETTEFATLPQAQSCRILSFESASVSGGFAGGYKAFVRGIKPYMNMRVELVPRVYVDLPDYVEIEVVGCMGIGMAALAPYEVELIVTELKGKKGIEIVGANKTQRFDIPS